MTLRIATQTQGNCLLRCVGCQQDHGLHAGGTSVPTNNFSTTLSEGASCAVWQPALLDGRAWNRGQVDSAW